MPGQNKILQRLCGQKWPESIFMWCLFWLCTFQVRLFERFLNRNRSNSFLNTVRRLFNNPTPANIACLFGFKLLTWTELHFRHRQEAFNRLLFSTFTFQGRPDRWKKTFCMFRFPSSICCLLSFLSSASTSFSCGNFYPLPVSDSPLLLWFLLSSCCCLSLLTFCYGRIQPNRRPFWFCSSMPSVFTLWTLITFPSIKSCCWTHFRPTWPKRQIFSASGFFSVCWLARCFLPCWSAAFTSAFCPGDRNCAVAWPEHSF